MNARKLALALATGATLLAAAPAFAHPTPHFTSRAPAHGWRAQHYQPHRHFRAAAYAYYYRPRPIFVPAPVTYYPLPRPQVVLPGPAIYGSLPIGDARLRIGVQF